MSTKYKGWAIPIMRTNIKNLQEIGSMLRKKEVKKALTSKQAQEIYREIEMSAILLAVGGYVVGEDDDESFIGKLKARAYREAMTVLGGIDIAFLVAAPRLMSFIANLANNITEIAKLEVYEVDSRWGKKGDLKGLKGLERQLTPRAIGQFTGGKAKEEATGASDLPELPTLPTLPELPKLPKLPSL